MTFALFWQINKECVFHIATFGRGYYDWYEFLRLLIHNRAYEHLQSAVEQ
jgi:hypothetical protein